MKTRILHWGCRVILAAIFFYTGYIKIESPFQFAVTLAGYDLLPEAWIPFIAQYFPWAEIALGFFLLFDGVIFGGKPFRWKIRYAAAAATALLLFFSVILTITYFRGIDANCGCFDFSSKISPLTILRDSVILIPALYLLFERRKPAKSEEPGNPENPPGNVESDAS
ncbi:MAG: hypothetical protein FWF13_03235 [Acidobacteria bacterium]|nr:hypothetical protein [Acidobacteriota bacterium]